jgi:hypothetical protein
MSSRRKVDVPAMKQIAAMIDAKHPLWVIEFGSYSQEFLAFAMFPHPVGMVLTAPDGATLVDRMNRTERDLIPQAVQRNM